jgi:hypothetical protein
LINIGMSMIGSMAMKSSSVASKKLSIMIRV